MPDEREHIFADQDVTISETVARFGDASYPIANIGSVRVEIRPKFHPLSIVLFIAGAAAFLWSSVVAMILIVIGIVVMVALPRRVAKLILRTSSDDVQALKSSNVGLVEDVKAAIETAFDRRG